MKICLFGGTFDPPHIGHHNIINNLLIKNYDKIIVMPTGDVNYKQILTDKQIRLEMVRIWVDSFKDNRLEVDDFEVNHCQISTTEQTIKYLKEKYPNDEIYMAIGYDSYIDLENWDNYDYLKDNVKFEVYNRDGSIEFNGDNIDVSSTSLRKLFNPELVPQSVLPLIVEKQIYDLQPFIVSYEQVKPTINIVEEIEKRKNFIKQTLVTSHQKALILGISGGQDSTLTAKLASLAIDELGRDYTLYLVRLPYKVQKDEDDCQDVLNWIDNKQTVVYNIEEATEVVNRDVNNTSDFNKGNIKARMRMIYQYALAGEVLGLVLGTDHSSENITGFFTKHGDGASDLNPLFGLNKRQGKMLLKHLGCPSHLYEKVPTADLEEDKPQLPDEVSLGVTYDQLDDYLENKQVDIKVKIRIEQLFVRSMHKRMVNNYR